MSHSPGPWRWTEASLASSFLVDPNCNMVSQHDRGNRALIASAPELLELVREICGFGAIVDRDIGRGQCICGKCFACKARSLLTRIEGEG